MAIVIAMVLSTTSLALAQPADWLDDVIAEDDTTTTTPRPFVPDPDPEPPLIPQQAMITLEGPEFLDVDEEGTYTIGVTNTSTDRALDEWVLGLSVTNIESADDLTISFVGGDGFDITNGTAGVDVEIDTNANIIYLRGSDDPPIGVGQSETFEFDASFANEGSFTGTAYVIDEDPFRGVTEETPEFLPYFNADGGVDENVAPPTKPLAVDGSGNLIFSSGANYEFDFCTLDRTRWVLEGTSTRVLSLNYQKCYNDGEVEYAHRVLMMNQSHPDFQDYVDAGNSVGFGGAWLVLSFEVVTPSGITVDVTDSADINTWASFPT